jgi:hypothetical protein
MWKSSWPNLRCYLGICLDWHECHRYPVKIVMFWLRSKLGISPIQVRSITVWASLLNILDIFHYIVLIRNINISGAKPTFKMVRLFKQDRKKVPKICQFNKIFTVSSFMFSSLCLCCDSNWNQMLWEELVWTSFQILHTWEIIVQFSYPLIGTEMAKLVCSDWL